VERRILVGIIWNRFHRNELLFTNTMKKQIILATIAAFGIATSHATTISTDFNLSDGFTTGVVGTSVTIGGLVTFQGGQQQQSFFGPAYNSGPDAYVFVNAGPAGGFTSPNGTFAANTGDNTGLISFGGLGASLVSFHAADLQNGAATTFTSFDAAGNILESFSTQVDALNGTDANEILTFTATGANIASIGVDLPGPAANAPYLASIDTFTATVAVPEPSSSLLLGLGLGLSLVHRRRR